MGFIKVPSKGINGQQLILQSWDDDIQTKEEQRGVTGQLLILQARYDHVQSKGGQG